jgi:hypothetical protein
VLPLVCVLMTVILGCAALAIDLGRLYYTGAELQAAADAAALAATRGWQRYPEWGSYAPSVFVEDVAPRNRAGGAPADVDPADIVPIRYDPATRAVTPSAWGSNSGVQVTVRARVPYMFAGALGLVPPTVARTAAAWAASVNGATCVRPFMPSYTRNYEEGIQHARTWSSQGQNVPSDPRYWYNFAGIASLQPQWPHNNTPVGRTYVNLPPWVNENDLRAADPDRRVSGNWRPADLSGGGLAQFQRFLAAPVGSADCQAAAARLDDVKPPLTYPTQEDLLAAMQTGMEAMCHRAAFKRSEADAYCYDEKGMIGARVRVAFADVTPPPTGTNLWVREVTQIRVICYFRTSTDVCGDTYITDGYGRTSPFTLPGPYTTGYPPGTIATLLDGPVSMDVTKDVILGSKPGITQRLMLVK